jgi:signal transduction histidine kinase
VHEIATRLSKEGDRIARIVEGLLSFARRRHEDKAVISIDEILSDSMALTAAQLRKDNITVRTDLPDKSLHVLAQSHEIEQVFVNIISNARHALNEKFSGPHEDKILEITTQQMNLKGFPFVQVCFKDYGCGIPADIIDKVMNPFFSTKTEGKRTGLGLSISHGIVEEHGGRLSVKSQESRYTQIIMELPVHLNTPH